VSNVQKFYPANAAEKADNVLEQCLGSFEDVLVLGLDSDGGLDIRVTTTLRDAEVIALIARANFIMMRAISGE